MSRYALKKGITYDTDQTSDGNVVLTFDMVKNVHNFLVENFGCFSLYAFDHLGRPYKVVHAESEMERMALERLSETDLAMANEDFNVFDEDDVGEQGGDASFDDGDEDDDDDDDAEDGV